jgi:hypothetical protein
LAEGARQFGQVAPDCVPWVEIWTVVGPARVTCSMRQPGIRNSSFIQP